MPRCASASTTVGLRRGQNKSNVKCQKDPVCGGRECGNRMVALRLRKHSDGGERSNVKGQIDLIVGGRVRGNPTADSWLGRQSNSVEMSNSFVRGHLTDVNKTWTSGADGRRVRANVYRLRRDSTDFGMWRVADWSTLCYGHDWL